LRKGYAYLYSASGLASVGAAGSASFVSAVGAALDSVVLGSASDEVQRVLRRVISAIDNIVSCKE
jgi:hypothetical protein